MLRKISFLLFDINFLQAERGPLRVAKFLIKIAQQQIDFDCGSAANQNHLFGFLDELFCLFFGCGSNNNNNSCKCKSN
jgi:hypothetical protein